MALFRKFVAKARGEDKIVCLAYSNQYTW